MEVRTTVPSSELEIDEGGLWPRLEIGQRRERAIEIRLPSPQPATGERAEAEMLDENGEGVEQGHVAKQFCRIWIIRRREHACEVAERVIEVRQLEEDPEHRHAE